MNTNAVTEKIEGTAEAWETGQLGCDPATAAVSKVKPEDIFESIGLKMISIRLEQQLIDDFKFIARAHGMPYQSLMRESLKRFAEGELKHIMLNAQQRKVEEQKAEAAKSADKKPRSEKRKIA